MNPNSFNSLNGAINIDSDAYLDFRRFKFQFLKWCD